MVEDKSVQNLLKTTVMLLTLMLGLQGVILWRSFVLERRVITYFSQTISPRESSLGLSLNQPAPEFRVTVLGSQKEISLETFAGRPFLMVFSNMDCPHCIEMHPRLLAFHRSHPDLPVLMFLKGTPSEDLQESGIWIAPWDEGVVEVYQVPGTPWFYVIDEQGIIRASFTAKTQAGIEQMIGIIK